MENEFTLNINGSEYTVALDFNKYQDNDRTALRLIDTEDGGVFDASVNIPGALVPTPEYMVIKNYNFQRGLDKALINARLIEPNCLTFVTSGYITAPVHRLTDKAIAIRDAQFKEKALV